MEADSDLIGEAQSFILSGAELSHIYSDYEFNTAVMDGEGRSITGNILANVAGKTSKDGSTYYLVADEVKWISSDDTEEMAKYGLTEDDMFNDFAIVEEDGKTKDYRIADDARFFLQYGAGLDNPYIGYTIMEYLNDGPKEIYMRLYLDENGDVIFGYEPYMP